MKEFFKNIFSIRKEKFSIVTTILGIKITTKRYDKMIFYIHEKNEEYYDKIERRLKNIEFKQNLIMDYYMDAKDAKQASGNLRIFQKKDVELLKEFIRICEKHNLRYWLDFGSLLGAYRHKGFIPWDDDCDVSMPESDFIKLQQIVLDEITDSIQFIEWEKGYISRFIFKEDKLKSFLDIYCYEELGNYLQYKLPVELPHTRTVIHKDILFPAKDIMFEDITVKAPNNIEKYLQIRYGNYMLLPKAKHEIYGHVSIDEHMLIED